MDPIILASNKVIEGTSFCCDYTLHCGKTAPIYEVKTISGLSQIIGYAKFKNSAYGNVLYRGQCSLHPKLEPSIYRGIETQGARERANRKLDTVLKRFIDDADFFRFTKLDSSEPGISLIRLESVLQHYGGSTHFLDVVDNHWTALWFGQHRYVRQTRNSSIVRYERRGIDFIDIFNRTPIIADELYQYIILIAVDTNKRLFQSNGVSINKGSIITDLRTSLPSTFLRPHSQHGIVIKKRSEDGNFGLDFGENIVCILKVRIDIANNWLGSGELLSVKGLFPDPISDQGYQVLLNKAPLFEGTGYNIPYYM